MITKADVKESLDRLLATAAALERSSGAQRTRQEQLDEALAREKESAKVLAQAKRDLDEACAAYEEAKRVYSAEVRETEPF